MKMPAIVFLAMLLLISGRVAASETDAERNETQVLIDVSGSMKQNDPENLRTDATQLLINLLPDQTRVSLWLFAEDTKPLDHSDAIDGKWRERALKSSKAIHSRGIYTDIEGAIKTSLEQGFKGTGNKNLIILTDGMVDISKDIMVSADSRERILSEWLPKLQQQKIKVQTIGLSNDIDKDLLERLAFDTGGWYETAESAEQLQHLFLKTAQKVAPRDTLPLSSNQFNVDSSVQEFSLLVFKKADAEPIRLLTPNKTELTLKTHPENLSWLETKRYDLITVKQPETGDWRIDATMDPDNQVMILTDLRMHIAELANFFPEQQPLTFGIHFSEKGVPITRQDFFDVLAVTLTIDDQAPVRLEPVKDQPGHFASTVRDIKVGKHNAKIVADGQTFKREINREFEVVSAPITVTITPDTAQRSVTLTFHPNVAIIDSHSLVINVAAFRSNQSSENNPVSEKNGVWAFKLDNLIAGETAVLNFEVLAQSLDGSPIKPLLSPVTLDDALFAPAAMKDISEKPTPIASPPAEPAAKNTDRPAAASDDQQALDENTGGNWLLTLAITVAGNLILGALGFWAYLAIKKSTHRKQLELMERLA